MTMDFRKTLSIEPVAGFISDRISSALKDDKTVLWLVPGGSAITVVVEVAKRLQGKDLNKLAVTLTDERYGPVGHEDSNWRQLKDKGFNLPGAAMVPVLTGEDIEATTDNFQRTLKELIEDADYKIGIFGIGADGHTAGILPNSPAVSSKQYAASYDAGNFKRITMTPLAILRMDEAVVYATGETKHKVLDELEAKIEIDKQPAQALKFLPRLTIFNDYKGEAV